MRPCPRPKVRHCDYGGGVFLDLNRAHRGVHLDLLVKAVVVSLRKVLYKVTSPRAAEAARRIQPRIETQTLAGNNLLQRACSLSELQLIVILNASSSIRSTSRVLQDEGFVRRTEQRIPQQAPMKPVTARMMSLMQRPR